MNSIEASVIYSSTKDSNSNYYHAEEVGRQTATSPRSKLHSFTKVIPYFDQISKSSLCNEGTNDSITEILGRKNKTDDFSDNACTFPVKEIEILNAAPGKDIDALLTSSKDETIIDDSSKSFYLHDDTDGSAFSRTCDDKVQLEKQKKRPRKTKIATQKHQDKSILNEDRERSLEDDSVISDEFKESLDIEETEYPMLKPELRELAQIMGSSGNERRRKWDWKYIEKRASKGLQKFISSKRKYSSFHISPMRIVVTDAKAPAFLAYSDKVREKYNARYNLIDEEIFLTGLENPTVEPQSHLEVQQPERKLRRTCRTLTNIREQQSKDVTVDATDKIDYSSLLTPDILELAEVMDSQKCQKQKRLKWDWNYIESKASKNLTEFIAIKRQNSSFKKTPMRVVVGDDMTATFLAYRESLRVRKISKRKAPVFSHTRPEPLRKKKCIEKEEHKHEHLQEPLSNNYVKLAELLAKAKFYGKSWGYVESMASEDLKGFIQARAKGSDYLMNPLRSLVPSKHFSQFQSHMSVCYKQFIEAHGSWNHEHDQSSCKQNDEDLAKNFALERLRRIKTFTKILRSEVRSFELKELALWKSFS